MQTQAMPPLQLLHDLTPEMLCQLMSSGALPFQTPTEYDEHGAVGFPTEKWFDRQVAGYLRQLNPKKRAKALMSQEMYGEILTILQTPKQTDAVDAQFRFWCKRTFRLVTGPNTAIVVAENRPVAVMEQFYAILVGCHGEVSHGGRDKTSAQVRRFYSWIPKEIVSRFVRGCPTCESKRKLAKPGMADLKGEEKEIVRLAIEQGRREASEGAQQIFKRARDAMKESDKLKHDKRKASLAKKKFKSKGKPKAKKGRSESSSEEATPDEDDDDDERDESADVDVPPAFTFSEAQPQVQAQMLTQMLLLPQLGEPNRVKLLPTISRPLTAAEQTQVALANAVAYPAMATGGGFTLGTSLNSSGGSNISSCTSEISPIDCDGFAEASYRGNGLEPSTGRRKKTHKKPTKRRARKLAGEETESESDYEITPDQMAERVPTAHLDPAYFHFAQRAAAAAAAEIERVARESKVSGKKVKVKIGRDELSPEQLEEKERRLQEEQDPSKLVRRSFSMEKISSGVFSHTSQVHALRNSIGKQIPLLVQHKMIHEAQMQQLQAQDAGFNGGILSAEEQAALYGNLGPLNLPAINSALDASTRNAPKGNGAGEVEMSQADFDAVSAYLNANPGTGHPQESYQGAHAFNQNDLLPQTTTADGLHAGFGWTQQQQGGQPQMVETSFTLDSPEEANSSLDFGDGATHGAGGQAFGTFTGEMADLFGQIESNGTPEKAEFPLPQLQNALLQTPTPVIATPTPGASQNSGLQARRKDKAPPLDLSRSGPNFPSSSLQAGVDPRRCATGLPGVHFSQQQQQQAPNMAMALSSLANWDGTHMQPPPMSAPPAAYSMMEFQQTPQSVPPQRQMSFSGEQFLHPQGQGSPYPLSASSMASLTSGSSIGSTHNGLLSPMTPSSAGLPFVGGTVNGGGNELSGAMASLATGVWSAQSKALGGAMDSYFAQQMAQTHAQANFNQQMVLPSPCTPFFPHQGMAPALQLDMTNLDPAFAQDGGDAMAGLMVSPDVYSAGYAQHPNLPFTQAQTGAETDLQNLLNQYSWPAQAQPHQQQFVPEVEMKRPRTMSSGNGALLSPTDAFGGMPSLTRRASDSAAYAELSPSGKRAEGVKRFSPYGRVAQ